MKKVFLISVFLGLAVSYGYSQTYYYKAVADIDANGAKSKPASYKSGYITFSNNKDNLYISDKNGYRKSEMFGCKTTYFFRKTQDGTHIYQCYIECGSVGSFKDMFYYFSSDFSKSQWFSKGDSNFPEHRTEYIRTNGPEDDYDDDIPTF